jgi:hypothetical protein
MKLHYLHKLRFAFNIKIFPSHLSFLLWPSCRLLLLPTCNSFNKKEKHRVIPFIVKRCFILSVYHVKILHVMFLLQVNAEKDCGNRTVLAHPGTHRGGPGNRGSSWLFFSDLHDSLAVHWTFQRTATTCCNCIIFCRTVPLIAKARNIYTLPCLASFE